MMRTLRFIYLRISIHFFILLDILYLIYLFVWIGKYFGFNFSFQCIMLATSILPFSWLARGCGCSCHMLDNYKCWRRAKNTNTLATVIRVFRFLYPLPFTLSLTAKTKKYVFTVDSQYKDVMRISKTNCFHCSTIWIKYSPNKLYTKVSPVWGKFSEFLWPNNYKEVKPPTIWLYRKNFMIVLSKKHIHLIVVSLPLRIFNVQSPLCSHN